MPKIVPIKDLKDTGKMSELCHSSHETGFCYEKTATETWCL